MQVKKSLKRRWAWGGCLRKNCSVESSSVGFTTSHAKFYIPTPCMWQDLQSTLLDAARRCSTLLDATQRYSTQLNATRPNTTLLNATIFIRNDNFDATRRNSTLLDATNFSQTPSPGPPSFLVTFLKKCTAQFYIPTAAFL
jgi:hypothetical protein